jgi:DNA-binding CsgD family transcriptional regulator
VIYDQQALQVPGHLEVIQDLVAAGEQARSLAGLPMKLAVADQRLGLIPLRLDEPGTEAALLIHPSPLLEAITMLFESLWQRATRLRFRAGSEAVASEWPNELTGEDERLLVLLSGGLKDQAIARQLGVGLRTAERRISRIMRLLGAETRFQAGLQVNERGWLGRRAEGG